MGSLITGLISAVVIFAGALLGMWLQRVLPNHHLGKETQDVVKLSAGMIATLTALVLGLLVSSAKNSFDAVNTAVIQGSTKIMVLDRVLASYGPETKPAREHIRRSVADGIDRIWPRERTGMSAATTMERSNAIELTTGKLRELTPESEAQRQILAQARQILGDVGQTQLLLIEQLQNELPLALLMILVFWLTLLFVSFGLFAPPNVTSFTVLLVGACAVAAAIFLVVELNKPLGGFIEVSNAPLRYAVQHIGQ
jgi:hypothetical protein